MISSILNDYYIYSCEYCKIKKDFYVFHSFAVHHMMFSESNFNVLIFRKQHICSHRRRNWSGHR